MAETRGLLLGRRALGQYDERLSFLTDSHGRISVTAFGTRSLKSRRRTLLVRPHWLSLGLKRERRGYSLEHLALWHENPHCDQPETAEDFLGALAPLKRIRPMVAEGHLGLLHRIYSVKPGSRPPWFLRLRALHGFLYIDGRSPHFEPGGWPRGAGFDRPTGSFLPADMVPPPWRLGPGAMALFTAWTLAGLPDGKTPLFGLQNELGLDEGEGRRLIGILETLLQTPQP